MGIRFIPQAYVLETEFSPEEAIDRVHRIGIFLILLVIFGWFGGIMSFFMIFLLSPYLIVFVLVSNIFSILCFWLVRELRYYSNDDKFNWGGLLVVIGYVMTLIGIVIVIISILPYFELEEFSFSYPEAYNLIVAFMVAIMLIGFGGLISFVGLILLVIAFYKFGEDNNESLISIGGILMIILGGIGTLLIGIGMLQLASKARKWIARYDELEEIRRSIKEDIEKGKMISIEYISMLRGIPKFLLRLYISHWIKMGEIKGGRLGMAPWTTR